MDVAAAEEPTPAADSPEELQAERDRVWAEAQSLRSEGKPIEAAAAGEQMLAIERRWLGDDSADVVNSLQWLADVYEQAGEWESSLDKRKAALGWRVRVQGAQHWEAISARLALKYAVLRQRLTAEEREQLARAVTANEMVLRLARNGQYRDAIAPAEEALKIRRTILGEEHPDTATSLNNLGFLLQEEGDNAGARPYYEEALAINRQLFGEEHPNTATSLNNVGFNFYAMGAYAGARPYLEQAFAIRREAFGEDHPDTAMSLNNFGSLLQAMGDYAAARPYYEQALEIRRKVLGEEHPATATSLNNLGGLLKEMGDYAAAKPYYEQALAIRRKFRGEEHADTVASMNNLGLLLQAMGDYSAAQTHLEQALAINDKVLGEHHPNRAGSLNNLGFLLAAMGDHAGARPYYEKALAINRHLFGEEHPNTATSLNNLGFAFDSLGEYAAARSYYEQALASAAKQVDASAVAQNETGQLRMSGSVKYYLDNYVSFLLRAGEGDAEGYHAVLNWKGATLVRQRAARMVADNEDLAPLFAELQAVIREWSALTAAPQSDPRWPARVGALVREKERLELALSRESALFRAARAKVEVAELQAALPDGAALIDFFEYRFSEPPAEKVRWRFDYRRSLMAFVVRADGEVEMFDLGAVEPIEQAIDVWRLGYGAGANAEDAGRLLRERLWTPLEGAIGDATLVLVSPDGALGKLPFAALPGAKPDTYLIEDVALALVPVPQLIPTLMAGDDERTFDQELLLVGGVDYNRRDVVGSDGAGSLDAGGDAPPPVGDLLAVARSRGNARQTAAGQSWSALPGTSGEAAAIRQFFLTADEDIADGVTLLSGAAATEERFRELAPRSRILHVATHGFFAAEGPATALAGDDPAQLGEDLLGAGQAKPPRFPPGLLSGLVLAGANAPPALPDDPAEFADLPEDGILTAEELMFLPLNGVELVVLSACESGLGEVAGGEGLLGIQRAFQVAGARTTVATLWKVDDAMTQRLMTAFYRNALEGRMSYLDALRNAQLEMLHELRAQHAAGSETSRGVRPPEDATGSAPGAPYYWAAFTLSGDWR